MKFPKNSTKPQLANYGAPNQHCYHSKAVEVDITIMYKIFITHSHENGINGKWLDNDVWGKFIHQNKKVHKVKILRQISREMCPTQTIHNEVFEGSKAIFLAARRTVHSSAYIR